MPVKDCTLGENISVRPNADLYKCKIGDNSKIGSFVVIEEDVTIGKNCKIKDHVFIPTGVEIGDGCFVGPGVIFTNDKYPRAVDELGNPLGERDFELCSTRVYDNVSIGARSVIGPGLLIGSYSLIGMGSVVTRDIQRYDVVAGNPARRVADIRDEKFKKHYPLG